MKISKDNIYIADSPSDLLGWDIENLVGEDRQGRTIISAKSRGSGEVRYIHCTAEALPLWVLQKYGSARK